MIINHIVALKIDYNPKRVIFLNWAKFVIIWSLGTHGDILHFKESNSNLIASKNSNPYIPIVSWMM